MTTVPKKRIPHVSEARSHDDHRKAIDLVDEQAKAGHYRLEFSQQEIAPGHVRVITDRFETNTADKPAS